MSSELNESPARSSKPRANMLVYGAAAMASLIPLLMLVACLTAPRAADVAPGDRILLYWPWSLIVAVLPSLWLTAEYLSLFRRHQLSAGCLALPLAWLAIMCPFSLVFEMLGVAGVLGFERQWTSWWEVLTMFVAAMCVTFAAYGHVVWWRALRKEERTEIQSR
jgi:hypothetical protein